MVAMESVVCKAGKAAGPRSLVYSREDRPTANTHVHVSSHRISSFFANLLSFLFSPFQLLIQTLGWL